MYAANRQRIKCSKKFDISNKRSDRSMMRFGAAAASGASQPRAAHVFQRERHRSRTTCELSYQSHLVSQERMSFLAQMLIKTQVFLVHTR